MINHQSKDQTLTPAHRRKRIRGKVAKDKWLTGDCIRGPLHKDTYYGAVKYPKTDDNGLPIVKDGHYVYDTDKSGNEIITMVKRILLSDLKESDIKNILDPTIRKRIETVLAQRKADGKSFETAIKEPIWLLDKDGNEIKITKNGQPVLPIRHVRCKAAVGRGIFTKATALAIKKQTYPSSKDYKNYYYVQNDRNYLCLLYEGVKKGKVERMFKFLNYFEIAQLHIKSVDDLKKIEYFNHVVEKKCEFNLTAIVKDGTRVIMWEQSPDEILDLPRQELSRRLYIVYKFNFKGANCIYLRNHIDARNDIKKEEDFTTFDKSIYQAQLTLVANSFNCLIENRDFTITEIGEIVLK